MRRPYSEKNCSLLRSQETFMPGMPRTALSSLQRLEDYFRLPLTPSSLSLGLTGLIAFRFFRGSRYFFLRAAFLFYNHKGYYSSFTSIPHGNFTSKCRESLATAFSKAKSPCFLQEGSQESRTRTALVLQEQILWDFILDFTDTWF